MPIDAQIPLSVQPAPAISPMQSIGQLMQLKDVSSQVALRQAQTEHFQQQAEQERAVTEQKNRDLQAVKNLQGLLSDPSTYTKIAKGDYAPLYQHGGITPSVIDAFVKDNDAKLTTAQTLKEGQAKLYAGQRSILQNALEGVMSEKDDATSASQYQQMKAELSKEAPDIAQHLPDLSAGPTYRQQLSDLSNVNGFHHALLQHAADEEAKKANTEKDLATTRKLGLESDVLKHSVDVLKDPATRERLLAQIDSEIPAGRNKLYADENNKAKQAVLGHLSSGDPKALELAQKAIQDSADRIGRHEAGVAAAKEIAPTKVSIFQQEQASRNALATPSDSGLELMAQQVLSGQPISSSNPILVAKVYERAAAIAKEHGLSTTEALMQRNSAIANQGALKSVTKQYETLKPFADMAEKNADVLEKAVKDVSDLGGSILNTPLRDIEAKFGGTKTAAFRAALMPVQADFARILNSPTGGGVLSDHARAEMQQAISPGATPGQVKAALDIFRQDAHNRRESYEATIKDLGGASVFGGSQQHSAAPASTYKAGDKRTINGKTVVRDADGNWK